MRKTYWVDRRINRFFSDSNDNTRQNGLNRYRKKPFAFPLHQQSRGKQSGVALSLVGGLTLPTRLEKGPLSA